jgi:hypothetical protein
MGDRKVPHVFCHQVYVLDHLLLQGCISVSSHADLPFTLCSPDLHLLASNKCVETPNL